MFFYTVEKPPRLSEFDLEIPENLIAKHPAKKRDNCKLMVLNKKEETIQHMKFSDIHQFFKKGDVLVLNNTKVYPARLMAKKDRSDAKVEVFLLRELANDLWEAMVKPARKVRIGNKLIFGEGIICDVIDNTVSGGRVIRFDYNMPSIYPFIDANGASPLPPYIDRKPVPSDKENYQKYYDYGLQLIKKNGLIQPLIVTKKEIDTYTLVAGERRLRASKVAIVPI